MVDQDPAPRVPVVPARGQGERPLAEELWLRLRMVLDDMLGLLHVAGGGERLRHMSRGRLGLT